MNQFDPRGRAGRVDFFILGMALQGINSLVENLLFDRRYPMSELFPAGRVGPVELVNITFLLPALIVVIRRAHDFASPGWPWALGLLVIATTDVRPDLWQIAGGWLHILLVFPMICALMTLYLLPGTAGPNRYGPNPRRAPDDTPQAKPATS